MNHRIIYYTVSLILAAPIIIMAYYTVCVVLDISAYNARHTEAVRYALLGTSTYYGTTVYNQTAYLCRARHCYLVVSMPDDNLVCHIQCDEPVDFRQRPQILPDCTLFAYKNAFRCITMFIVVLFASIMFAIHTSNVVRILYKYFKSDNRY